MMNDNYEEQELGQVIDLGSNQIQIDDASTFVVEGDTGKIEEYNNPEMPVLTDFDKIKATAKVMGIKIQDPRKNCKNCYGRGYTGFNTLTKQPITCHCIFPKAQTQEEQLNQLVNGPQVVPNRAMRRKMEKQSRRK